MIEREKLISLVRAVQNGEDGAATLIYSTFRDDIYYYIKKTVKDIELAEDLTQDTFIEILGAISTLKEPAAFVSWSRQIAYHKCTGYFKKRKDLLVDEDEDGNSMFDTLVEDRDEFIPDEALDKEELKRTIQEMIDTLPEEQRTAIQMRYFDEMSVKEIAEIQGVTEGTVKSRLNYGRKAIKRSVDEYEEKNGVKLHCVGAIPLLLWLFREQRLANGMSLTTQTTTAVASTLKNVSPATSTVKTVTRTATKVVAEKGAKQVVKKIVASVAAVAIFTGGMATGVVLQPKIEEVIQQKDAEKILPQSELPVETEKEEQQVEGNNVWYGYGESFGMGPYRFEITVDEKDDTNIKGHLNVSHLYSNSHDTDFEGTGIKAGNTITYKINFSTALISGLLNTEYTEIELIYDIGANRFAMDDFYEVIVECTDESEDVWLEENVKWSGYGDDSLCVSLVDDDHLFEIYVYEMNEAKISGKLTVSCDGVVEHESEFVGRGYKSGNISMYEISLETIRVISGDDAVDYFWLRYNYDTDTFEFSGVFIYSAEMKRE